MWAVRNRTPYAADSTWVLDKDAVKSWVVVVKATFDIGPNGTLGLADEQQPALNAARYRGDPTRSGLLYESDLLGPKPATDFIVNADAHAPGGRPATAVEVSIKIGSLSKQLQVVGDRHWERGVLGLSPTPAMPFLTMPLIYERAYGGSDPQSPHSLEARNPIGTGFDARLDQALPNISYPGEAMTRSKSRPRPAGLGPIPVHWTPRREMAGTYDENWLKTRMPLWAEDFDARFNQCAPQDQQVPHYLRGGEPVELINLTQEGRLFFHLPRLYPFFVTRFGEQRMPHRGHLYTVIVEPSHRRLIMVWHTALQCHHKVDELDETLVTEKQYI